MIKVGLGLIKDLRRLNDLSIRKPIAYHIHGWISPKGVQSEYVLVVVKTGVSRKAIRRLGGYRHNDR